MYAIRSYYEVLATEPALDSRCGRQLQQGAITSFLLNLLDGSEVERQAGRSLARRRQVVGAAREYVQAHPDEVRITSYNVCYTKLLRFLA